ncbi:peroxiredoxin C [Buchnera aphidicola str. APS (Acyrthosiphon pisum)]|uniref:Alkyl hydroperoxide reductase C n=2 Tax=Buchnera aphidicola TaxID=9 RepID=AHPC_BUCAI|nr:peroxiredoxin C [Buchnera aphidicola]P57279.1 RecName: Full=Alkyl hydroperoxide reductase C; AltName: Full=Peroxiredoxin; AltName: Full=Thioredoxin peroxidase [Buchnera aphidicola str. APS (Acyrthosiphon pisum)]pir/C84951/ alkyl hydroperoxide reductase [imported] - Buchnera sp. (strain APS) [Buchnera sp. (in: enterobacteria)]ADP66576.1 alkyl hydroperoxide reductase [Buchnera aphidicola str. TLW03 (Acyrthosiphon pisum)]ADP67707.1 alkyl hydroperoxide reductase [Buchnera aphidicola str. JF98 (A
MVLVTQNAPNFIAPAILKNNQIVEQFDLKKYSNGQSTVLFFWPMDFTFVCPSEIIEFNKLHSEFKKRNVKIVGVSIDSVYVHQAWQNTLPKNGGIGKINFPMVSDVKHDIQKSYGIQHPNLGIALRASFLIDSNWIIRHQVVNDLPFGRNITDMIRMVDALDFHNKFGEVCPANWKKGEEGITASSEGVSQYLSKYS